MNAERLVKAAQLANDLAMEPSHPEMNSWGDLIGDLLNEREALLEALKAAADKLLWANSNLMHSWAQERPCDHEAAAEADEGEKAARAAIAKAEAE